MHLRTRDSSFISLNLIIHFYSLTGSPCYHPRHAPATFSERRTWHYYYYGISPFLLFLFSYGFSAAILLKKALLFPTTGFEL